MFDDKLKLKIFVVAKRKKEKGVKEIIIVIIKEEIKLNTLIKKDDEKIYDDTLIYIYCDKKVNQDKYRERR